MEASHTDIPSYPIKFILSIWPNGKNHGEQGEVWDTLTARVYKVFDGQEGFRYSEKYYEYEFHGPDGIKHSLELLGRSIEDTKGRVVCLGGQGSTALEDWMDECSSGTGYQSGPTTWKLDLAEVNARLSALQKNWWYPKKIRHRSTKE